MKNSIITLALSMVYLIGFAQNSSIKRYIKLDEEGKKLHDSTTKWDAIYDTKTKLYWEVKTADNSPRHFDSVYFWGGDNIPNYQGIPKTYGNWNKLVNYVNETKLCGFDDWRVPTIKELETISSNSEGDDSLYWKTNATTWDKVYLNPNYFPHALEMRLFFWSTNFYDEGAMGFGYQFGDNAGVLIDNMGSRVMLVRKNNDLKPKVLDVTNIEPYEGFINLPLSITKSKELETHFEYKASAIFNNHTIGITIKLEKNIPSGLGGIINDNEESKLFLKNGIELISNGKESDLLIKCLAKKYDLDSKRLIIKKHQSFTCTNLNNDKLDYNNGYYRFKIFIEQNGEYAELYINFDFSKGIIWLNEKDTSYRESLIKLMQQKTPTYDDVVNHFYNSYDVRSFYDISFEKKKSAWYVTNESIGGLTRDKIWDKEFIKLDNFFAITHPNPEPHNINEQDRVKKLKDYQAKYYNMSPSYGYIGWDKEIVNEYGKKTKLSDTMLYMVARAYSSLANNLLQATHRYTDSSFVMKNTGLNKKLTKKEYKKYKKYSSKAIKYFKLTKDKNPSFRTMIGPIATKLNNEYLVNYLNIYQFTNNRKKALKEIPSNLYSSIEKEIARNYLKSCETNAIFLSNGDNDLFPLLYLQEKENYRKDVLLINTSLLGSKKYLQHLILNKGLNIDYDLNKIEDYKVITNDNESRDLITSFKALESQYLNEGKLKLNEYIKVNDYIGFCIVQNSYLTANQFYILKILSSAGAKRKIYSTSFPRQFQFLNLRSNGILFSFYSIEQIEEKHNVNNSYNLIMNKYSWSGLNEYPQMLAIKSARVMYINLCNSLINDNKIDSAKLVLKKLIALYTPNYPADIQTVYLASIYNRLEEKSKVKTALKKVITNINNNINIYYADNKYDQIKERNKLIKLINKTIENNNMEELRGLLPE